jgi:hypothetical protein
VIYCATLALRELREHGLGVAVRGLAKPGAVSFRAAALLVLAPLTLLATPYGTGMVHYYSVTLGNSEFSKLVSEWKPTISTPVLAAPLFLLIAYSGYVMLRSNRRTPPFDHLVLAMLAIGAVMAVRNITWFGLGVVVLLPAAISHAKQDRPAPLRSARVNRLLALVMAGLALLMGIVTLAQPDSWFTSTYPSNALPTLDRLIAADPSAKVFADVRYADWLIWQQPRVFSGRVAYDTSLELLTDSQLRAIALLTATRRLHGVPRVLQPYGIWVLNPANRAANRVLLRQPGVRVVVRSKRVIIATQAPVRPVQTATGGLA